MSSIGETVKIAAQILLAPLMISGCASKDGPKAGDAAAAPKPVTVTDLELMNILKESSFEYHCPDLSYKKEGPNRPAFFQKLATAILARPEYAELMNQLPAEQKTAATAALAQKLEAKIKNTSDLFSILQSISHRASCATRPVSFIPNYGRYYPEVIKLGITGKDVEDIIKSQIPPPPPPAPEVKAPPAPPPVVIIPKVEKTKKPGKTAKPIKAEPIKAEPVKAEPVKTEPVKAEPVKAEPVKAEPVKAPESAPADPLEKCDCTDIADADTKDSCVTNGWPKAKIARSLGGSQNCK